MSPPYRWLLYYSITRQASVSFSSDHAALAGLEEGNTSAVLPKSGSL